MKEYLNTENFGLILGDVMSVLTQIEDGSIDLIFADPPYFLSNDGTTCKGGKRKSVNKGRWDKSNGIALDHKFNMFWLRQCRRILKPDGAIWVCGTHHNIFSVGFSLQSLGFKILNNVVWEKPAPPPNLGCRTFTHSTENLLWAARDSSSKYTFNYKDMKVLNEGKQMKDVWRVGRPSKIEQQFGKYPTQKPEALLELVLLATTKEGDFVLDPFCGSGTTGAVAARLGRRFLGVDNNEEALEITKQRFQIS